MQPDPIEDGDGPNLYAYVGNDPVNWSDPTGEIGVIGGLIGGGIELGAQILSGDARSYRAAASQILTGQRCTACRDAGRNLAKVGISAAGGAAGAGFLGVATKGLNFGQKAFVPANFGAKVGVITTGLKGAVDRRLTGTDLAVGAGVGAVTGGLGSFAPTAAGQAAARATGFRGARGPTEFSTDASLNALGEVAQGTLTAASGASKPTKRR